MNSNGEITEATYDAAGRLVTMTDASGTSRITHDRRGRERRAEYSGGLVGETTYDYRDEWKSMSSPTLGTLTRNWTRTGKLAGWEYSEGRQVTFGRDAAGRLLTENRNGRATTYTYDAAGRVETDTAPNGAVTRYTHDTAGRVTAVTDPLGHVRRTEYLIDGRPKAVVDPRGKRVTFSYDLTSTETTDPLGRVTRFETDGEGVPTRVVYPDGTFEETTYLGATPLLEQEEYPITVRDAGGKVRSFTYDALGRLATATDLAGATTTMVYGSSFLESVRWPTGETVFSLEYDGRDNVRKKTYGDGAWAETTYGANNQPETVSTSSGRAIAFAYDGANRLTSRTSGGESISFGWNVHDERTSVTDSTGTTTFEYDALGLLVGEERSSGERVEYERDLAARVSAVRVRGTGSSAVYETLYDRDESGNVTSITDPLGGVTTFAYDDAGRLVNRTLPNGLTTSWGYDLRDRVLSVTHRRGDGSVLESVTLTRQGSGEPVRRQHADGSFVTYAYDGALRLREEKHHSTSGALVETITYGYDLAGNRTSRTSSAGAESWSYSVGARLQSVSGPAGTTSYGYDGDGRATSIATPAGATTLGYDSQDLLSTWTNAATGTTASYSHDGLGRRVRATVAGVERRIVTAPILGDGLDAPQLVTDASGSLTAAFVWAGGSPLMRFDASGPVYYLTDGIGSVVALADGTASTVATFRYDGFGNVRSASGPAATAPAALGGDFRFQGQWQESATGLYHLRAREYDPKTGRFLTKDSAAPVFEEPESLHPYVFANGNPNLFGDPTGEYSLPEINIGNLVQSIVNSIRTEVVNILRQRIVARLQKFAADQLVSWLQSSLGMTLDNLPIPKGIIDDYGMLGEMFERSVQDVLCVLHPSITNNVYFEPQILTSGVAVGNGYSCAEHLSGRRAGHVRGGKFPDLILKNSPPTETKTKTLVLGEFKFSVGTFVKSWLSPGRQRGQWDAIRNHAIDFAVRPRFIMLVSFRPGTNAERAALSRELNAYRGRVVARIFSIIGGRHR